MDKAKIQASFQRVRTEIKEIGLVSLFLGMALIVNIPALYAWDRALMAMIFSLVVMTIIFFSIDYFADPSQEEV